MSVEALVDSAFDAVRQMVSKFTSVDEQLKRDHVETQRKLSRTIAAREPKKRLLIRIDQVVNAARDKWRADFSGLVLSSLSASYQRSPASGELRLSTPSLPVLPGDKLTFAALCGLCPDVVKASLREMVKAADYAEGLPGEDRADAIDALELHLRQLEDAHLDLVDRAAGMTPPIALKPIPEAQRRRELERRRREEQEAIERQREAANARWAAAGTSYPTMADGQNLDRVSASPTPTFG